METLDAIRTRRTIRKFQDKPIPREVLDQVLEAVQWSPSWANTQCWEIVVITDQAVKDRMQETLAKGNPATKAVAAAPVLLAVCGKLKDSGYYKGVVTTKFGDWFMFDLGICTQSLCLAAHDLGLGTVVVGLFDQDAAAKVVNLPEGYELVSLIPMGYPNQEPPAPKRKEIAQFTHHQVF